jgi:hypothetical protein
MNAATALSNPPGQARAFTDATRVLTSVLAPLEKRVLVAWLAGCRPASTRIT